MKHSIKVALDAGALMIIEGALEKYSKDLTRRKVCIVQCAGLLHDIKRKRKDHAIQGSVFARELLETYPVSPDEVNDICNAIHNHEAFQALYYPLPGENEQRLKTWRLTIPSCWEIYF